MLLPANDLGRVLFRTDWFRPWRAQALGLVDRVAGRAARRVDAPLLTADLVGRRTERVERAERRGAVDRVALAGRARALDTPPVRALRLGAGLAEPPRLERFFESAQASETEANASRTLAKTTIKTREFALSDMA